MEAAAFTRALLWLFVLNIGVAFGAGLYEGRITFANWLTRAPDGALHWDAGAAQRDNTGLRFWVWVTTVPLTLLTFANLIAAWQAAGHLRVWWLAAVAAALAERLFTFAYFIPTIVGLMKAADSWDAVATARRWAMLNHVRHVLTLTAWLAALKALTLLSAR